jgi:phage/plasmid-like protein (TIGR03299 family)
MSHELEFVNGVASFAGATPGWHKLGTVDPNLTYKKAVKVANLHGWNVRAVPFSAILSSFGDINPDAPVREFDVVDAPDHQIIIRDNPATGKVESLGVVGGRYRTVQVEDAFAHVPELERLGAKVDSAGSIRGGRQVFLAMTMEGGFVIDPEGAADRVQGYLLNRTSHDGSLAVEVCSTWVRVVCANTWDMVTERNQKRVYKVRHTAEAAGRLRAAQESFVMANNHGQSLGKLALALYRTPASTSEFAKLATAFYPKPGSEKGPAESKRGLTTWERKQDTLASLFTGKTNENIAGTAWAVVNAMTERIDHHRTARGGDGTSIAAAAAGFVPAIANEKQAILDLVVEWAKAKRPKEFQDLNV